MVRQIKAALFDLDNTLADRKAAFIRLAKQFWSDEPSVQSVISLEDATDLLVEWDADGKTFPKRQLFERSKRLWGKLTRSPEELEQWYTGNYTSFFRPDDRVTEFVNSLDFAGIPWGIVTNGPPFQIDTVRSIGLINRGSGVAISSVLGVSKPDPAIFVEGLRLVGTSASECLFVGDDPLADIEGARSVGMQTAWVRRGREWVPGLPPPNIVIDHVSDLSETLGL